MVGWPFAKLRSLQGKLVLANRRRLKSKAYADGLKSHMERNGHATPDMNTPG
jgi:hypothetical protein